MQQIKNKKLLQNSLRIEHQDYALTAQLYDNKLRLSLQFFSLHDYKVYTSVFAYLQLPQIFQFFYQSIYCIEVNAQKGIVNFKVVMVKKQNKVAKNLQLSLMQQTVEQNVRNAVIIGKLTKALDKKTIQLQKKDKQLKNKEQQNIRLKKRFKQIMNNVKKQINGFKAFKQAVKQQIKQQAINFKLFKNKISTQCNQLEEELAQTTSPYYFLQNMKHPNFSIKGSCKNVLISTNFPNKMAIIQSKFQFQQQGKYEIQFIMVKKTNVVGIGICDKQIIEKYKYVFNHPQRQKHGTYMLLDHFTSSFDQNLHMKNCSQKIGRIKQGDVIKAVLQTKYARITFYNNNKQLQLKYKKIKLKSIHFCVYMQHQGDIIRIRKPKQ